MNGRAEHVQCEKNISLEKLKEKSISQIKLHYCEFCPKFYNNRSSWRKHRKKKHILLKAADGQVLGKKSDKPGKSSKSAKIKSKSGGTNQDKKVIKTNTSSYNESNASLKKRYRSKVIEEYPCVQCEKMFRYPKVLNKHLLAEHGDIKSALQLRTKSKKKKSKKAKKHKSNKEDKKLVRFAPQQNSTPASKEPSPEPTVASSSATTGSNNEENKKYSTYLQTIYIFRGVSTCPGCFEHYENDIEFFRHLQKHDDSDYPWSCKLCGRRFQTQGYCRLHIERDHETEINDD